MTTTVKTPTLTLDERVTALEKELTEMKAQRAAEPARSPVPWWESIWGAFKDDMDYAEATRLGREYRESLRPVDYADNKEQEIEAKAVCAIDRQAAA